MSSHCRLFPVSMCSIWSTWWNIELFCTFFLASYFKLWPWCTWNCDDEIDYSDFTLWSAIVINRFHYASLSVSSVKVTSHYAMIPVERKDNETRWSAAQHGFFCSNLSVFLLFQLKLKNKIAIFRQPKILCSPIRHYARMTDS